MAKVVAALDDFAGTTSDSVVAVVDGRPFELKVSAVEVVFAPGGPNAADAEILRLLAFQEKDCTVVTSDRDLGDRARALGARVMGAGEFRSRLDGSL